MNNNGSVAAVAIYCLLAVSMITLGSLMASNRLLHRKVQLAAGSLTHLFEQTEAVAWHANTKTQEQLTACSRQSPVTGTSDCKLVNGAETLSYNLVETKVNGGTKVCGIAKNKVNKMQICLKRVN